MKYYTIESYSEKEAPFQIAWRVKLFDKHTLLNEYEHIFYNEVAGYCKCLEDMGFIKNVEVKVDTQKEFEKPNENLNVGDIRVTMTDEEISDFVKMCMRPMIDDLSRLSLFDSAGF